jgi:division protein CdvB (Snf7/Vps24/ESCRT-III family)
VLTRSSITGLISEINQKNTGPQHGPQTEATILSMSRLETAMNRLDAAMARLDAAVHQTAERGGRGRESMEKELTALRRTHALLQEEARHVSDRLDHAVGRLQSVVAGSH